MTSVTIKGLREVISELSITAAQYIKAVDNGVVATAGEIQREAVLSIQKQSVGELGYSSVRKGKVHRISKKGNAPNTDSGRLVGSIKIVHIKGSEEAQVFTDLDYGAYLELVLDRAWLQPAMQAKAGELQPNIEAQLKKYER